MSEPAKESTISTPYTRQVPEKRQTLRKKFPLRFRKIVKKNFWSVLGIVFFWLFGSFLLLKFMDFPDPHGGQIFSSEQRIWFSWVAILFLALLWRTGYEILYFYTYFYDMDDQNVIIRKGVFARKEVNLPFSKITDVYIDQDILDVIFGLCDLHISTPTAESGVFAHIDGLNKRNAVALKKLVLERINN